MIENLLAAVELSRYVFSELLEGYQHGRQEIFDFAASTN